MDQHSSFHRFGPNCRQLNFLNINFPLKYVRDRFWKPGTYLKTVFSWVSLANLLSTIFGIFIWRFPDINLFSTNCNLLQFLNRFWSFCIYFCFFIKYFCSFLLVYQSFLLVPTSLLITSCFYSFMSLFYSCVLIYQKFLLVYQSFHILVLTQGPYATSNINKHFF